MSLADRQPEPQRTHQLRNDLASLRIERDAPAIGTHPRRRWPRRLVVALVLIGILAAVWVLTQQPVTVAVAPAVAASPAEAAQAPVLSGSGYIVTGDRYVSIGVRVPGRIDRYFVEEGQSVHRGDPLVQLDDRDYRAAVQRAARALDVANANLQLAEADWRRGEALRKDGVISVQEFDVFRNKAEVARATVGQLTAELAQARVNLEYTTLHAPTDGVVLAKLKEVGEIAVPGGFAGSGDLIRLANMTDMRAEVDVNEADLNRVHMGQPAEVTPDAYPDAHYGAEVVKLYPQVDRQKGTLKIEVHIPQPDARLLPDMSARISFLSDHGATPAPAVMVRSAAVHQDQQSGTFVWLADNGHARRVRVVTAGELGDRTRVSSGLHGGESVIVTDRALRDGQRVQVIDNQ